ncbi:hypothetical protein N9X54_00500 [Planktomarina temperata]|nr:hypothetical protein [Planktomarina temperata]
MTEPCRIADENEIDRLFYDRGDYPIGAMHLTLAVVERRIRDALTYRRGRMAHIRSEYAYTEALRDACSWLGAALPNLDIPEAELFGRLDSGVQQAAEAMGQVVTLAKPRSVKGGKPRLT